MIRAFAALILVLAACPSSARAEDPAVRSAAFSDVPVGARAPALGGGIAAIDDGATAAVLNPAGLAGLAPAVSAAAQAAVLPDGESEFLMAAAAWATPELSVGVAVFSRGLGKVEFRRANTLDPDRVEEAIARVWTASLGTKFFSALDLGVSIRYMEETIGELAASGLSSDLGLVYRPWPRITAALVVRDIPGTSLGWSSGGKVASGGSDNLERSLVLGGAVDLNPLLLVAQADDLAGDYRRFSGGVEWDLHQAIILRAGAGHRGPAFGFGVRLPVRRRHVLRLDYALAPNPYGGVLEHRVALSFDYRDFNWEKGRILVPGEEESRRPDTPNWVEPARRPHPLFTWPDLKL